MIYWNVYLKREYFDTVGLDAEFNQNVVIRKLIEDGYPEGITAHPVKSERKINLRHPEYDHDEKTILALAFERAYEKT